MLQNYKNVKLMWINYVEKMFKYKLFTELSTLSTEKFKKKNSFHKNKTDYIKYFL